MSIFQRQCLESKCVEKLLIHFRTNGNGDKLGKNKIISSFMLSPKKLQKKIAAKIYKEKFFLKTDNQPRKYSACSIQQTISTENETNIYFRNQRAEYFGPNIVENPLNWENLKKKHFCRLKL